MQIVKLDHVNVRTSNLVEMVDWYERILGLKSGDRPKFPFPGAWVYAGDQPIIHLVPVEKECASIEPKIEHFALSATGFSSFIQRLEENDIEHSVDPVPGRPLVQVNLTDFDGNHIHIDFDTTDVNA